MKKIIIEAEYEWYNKADSTWDTIREEIVNVVPEQPDGDYKQFETYDNYVSYVLGEKLSMFTRNENEGVIFESDGEYRVIRIKDIPRVTARVEETLDVPDKPKLIVAK